MKTDCLALSKIPKDFLDRVGWGLYGGRVQFYIKGVDGTLAQLGSGLPDDARLRKVISDADAEHRRAVVSATSVQRAEAFLRTIGKWKD